MNRFSGRNEVSANGHVVQLLGPATGHFITPIAFCNCAETAAFLAKLVNDHATLVSALEPFAKAAGMLPLTHGPDNDPIDDDEEVSIRCCGFQIDATGRPITVADLKRLAAALSQAKSNGGEQP